MDRKGLTLISWRATSGISLPKIVEKSKHIALTTVDNFATINRSYMRGRAMKRTNDIKTITVRLRITPAEYEVLSAFAASQNKTMSDVIRKGIELQIKKENDD